MKFKLFSSEDVNFDENPWPVEDEEGYYQSYKENGAWVNHWHRDMPGFLTIMSGFMFSEDHSDIPGSNCLNRQCLNDTLPVTKPYWVQNPEEFGKDLNTVKATWLGHASVLAEVDGAIILADPIFSQRCSPFQWAGPKRY